MLLTHRTQDKIDIVDLSGKLVMGDAVTEARKKLLDVIKVGQGNLILNLSKVSFMDSSGLSVLISALKAARGKKGDVVLLGLTPAVRTLIELTRLQQIFNIFQEEAAAVTYMNS
jgi:anti-sigma B factor antagonist